MGVLLYKIAIMKDLQKIREWLSSVGADPNKLDEKGCYGGSLDLSSVTSLPDGFNPTVGGYLYLRSVTKHINKKVSIPTVFHWEWRGRRFIKADDIFQEVVSQRGNVYRVKNIGSKDVTYLVTDGNDRWSHGKTLKEAKEDLIYKISNRDTSRYESLTLDDVLTRAEAIECYRVITGACAQGTKAFVTSLLEVKDEYTIREIITLTEGRYGSQAFKDYFNK